MLKVLVVAPHPDDETLGAGGTLLRHAADGAQVHWLVVTDMTADLYPPDRIADRELEISALVDRMGFSAVHRLGFPTSRLDQVTRHRLVEAVGEVFAAVAPEIVYLPHPGDAHSDHEIVFDACAAATKWFRYPTIRSVRIYETPSETDFGISPNRGVFSPNLFVDISCHLASKLEAAGIFGSEMAAHPFPRSEEGLRALATVRGAASGYEYAEAFMIARERR